MRDGSLYKDGSITSCLQAAFQAQMEEEEQQGLQVLPFSILCAKSYCVWHAASVKRAQEINACCHVYVFSDSAAKSMSKPSTLPPSFCITVLF